jgi:hypothetical protein
LFLPDAAPERMPITASLAHLLFQDLHRLEQHEQRSAASKASIAPSGQQSGPVGQVLGRFEEIAERMRAGIAVRADQGIARILVAGVIGSGKSELIESLVGDLSPSHWAAVGNEGPKADVRAGFGLVRLSPTMLLHLIAVRAEKRFRSIWEECLPEALGVILLIPPDPAGSLSHIQAFLKARQAIASTLPVHAVVPAHEPPAALPALDVSRMSCGSLEDQSFRLGILDALLLEWLGMHPLQAKAGR